MKRRKWITAAAGLLAALAIWLGWDRHPAQDRVGAPGGLTAVVDRGDLEVHVESTGSVLTRESFKIVAQVKARAVIEYAVKQGTRVKPGDLLLKLGTDEIDKLLLAAEEKFSDDELDISDKETALEIQRIESSNNFETAENGLEAARLNLQKFLRAERPQKIREAELALRTGESEAVRTRKKLEDLRKLLAKQFVTEAEVEEQEVLHDKAVVDRDGAKLALEALHAYELPVLERDLTNKVDQAVINLRKVEVQNETKLRLAERSLEKAKADFERQKERLEELQELRGYYEYTSEVEGVVFYGDIDISSRYRVRTLEVGEDISPGQVLMSIPIASGMRAEVQVTEADIKQVKQGQRVLLTVDAAADRQYTGEVSEVAEVATDQGYYTTGIKEFRVTIDIDDTTGLKQGFSCRARILIDKVPDALRVPIQGVFKDGDDLVVYLVDGTRRPVVAGASSITHVQILDGLEEGDEILLTRPL